MGALQRGEQVQAPDGRTVSPDQVLGAPRPGRLIVVSGDTEPSDTLLAAADRASVLVHEATFLDEDRDRARETRHSTAREAAVLAREADVALLVLTHLSSRLLATGHPPRGRARVPARAGAAGLRPDRGALPGAGRAGDSRAARRGPARLP